VGEHHGAVARVVDADIGGVGSRDGVRQDQRLFPFVAKNPAEVLARLVLDRAHAVDVPDGRDVRYETRNASTTNSIRHP